MLPTPVKEYFSISPFKNLPFYQPVKASTEEFAFILRELKPDVFVVVAYGEIMRQNILDIPKVACLNIHASILPKYRGAAPIQRAILNGDKETGITFMHMVLKMDAGNMLDVVKVPIHQTDNFQDVEERLCKAACENLERVLDVLEVGNAKEMVQEESLITFADKITPEDLVINWNEPAQKVHDRVRTFSPRPGAYTYINVNGENKIFKIKRTEVVSSLNGTPGSTLSLNKNEWIIACGEGAVRLLEVQLEGKKSMEFKEFYIGMSEQFHISPKKE